MGREGGGAGSDVPSSQAPPPQELFEPVSRTEGVALLSVTGRDHSSPALVFSQILE